MIVQIPLFIWCISIPVVLGGIYNGGFGVGPAISYAAAPALSYAAAPAVSYAAAPAVSYAAAPSISYAAAPAISYAAAPAKLVAAAPAVTYAAAPAKVVAAAAPVAIKTIQPEPYDPNPQYSFAYGVSDHSTGDSKAAEESLVNGVVHGSYSLTEADGSVRKVTYTADDLNGFNAVVQKSGGAVAVVKPIAVPAVTKVAYAAPAFAKVAYASPSLYHH